MIRTDIPVGLSLSGGGASIDILHLVVNGAIPRPEHFAVLFANTKWENRWTYDEIDAAEELCKKEGITFIRCGQEEGLPEHLIRGAREELSHADHPALFIKKDNGGIGRTMQKCTGEFKIAPMRRAQRVWLKSIGQPMRIMKWIGYTAEETTRIAKAISKRDVEYELLDFPLARLGKRRAHVHEDNIKYVGRKIRWSACRGCPANTLERLREVVQHDPESLYEVDEATRDMSRAGIVEGDCYQNRHLMPIETLIKKGPKQTSFDAFDVGCDGGHCFL
mgnify:CR=1 FL=1